MVFIITVITIRIIKQFPWLTPVMPSWVDNLKCANQIWRVGRHMHRVERAEMIPSLVTDVGVLEGLMHAPSPSPLARRLLCFNRLSPGKW